VITARHSIFFGLEPGVFVNVESWEQNLIVQIRLNCINRLAELNEAPEPTQLGAKVDCIQVIIVFAPESIFVQSPSGRVVHVVDIIQFAPS